MNVKKRLGYVWKKRNLREAAEDAHARGLALTDGSHTIFAPSLALAPLLLFLRPLCPPLRTSRWHFLSLYIVPPQRRNHHMMCMFVCIVLPATQVVVLDNGCMCCTVRGDLLGAFASVLAKVEEARARGEGAGGAKGGGGALDSVLVETTGMADPVPIVRTLLQVRSPQK